MKDRGRQDEKDFCTKGLWIWMEREREREREKKEEKKRMLFVEQWWEWWRWWFVVVVVVVVGERKTELRTDLESVFYITIRTYQPWNISSRAGPVAALSAEDRTRKLHGYNGIS